MIKLLKKELILSSSPLSYFFILFALLAFCPGYPILVSAFFASLGIFQSFQSAREANDLTYSVLLPINKSDVVKAKYLFCCFIELLFIILATVVVIIRMTALNDVFVYRSNALMNANLSFLGFVFLVFGCFNSLFVCGFFKTAYKLAKPFVSFAIAAFLVVMIGETLFHIPSLEVINSFGFDNLGVQVGILLIGVALYSILTLCSLKRAIRHFEVIDL